MNPNPNFWPRALMILGLACILIGSIDPLEGSLLILPGSGLTALGANLGKSRQIRRLSWSLGLVAFGVAALWALSASGGLGGSTGRSSWWSLLLLPYAVGWLMTIVGSVLALIEFHGRRERPDQAGVPA